nr:hypothetical protein [Streptomyces sp. 846.5]
MSILTDRLITEVADAMASDPVGIEPDEYWGVAVPANLELLSLLARQGYVITTGRILPYSGVRRSGRMSAVPTRPSEHTRLQLELYLAMRAEAAWPRLPPRPGRQLRGGGRPLRGAVVLLIVEQHLHTPRIGPRQ